MKCSVCGSEQFFARRVLWPKLINDWQLSPKEADYIDAQQGTCCAKCGANIRSIALADVLRSYLSTDALLLDVASSPQFAELSILELNEAGMLSPTLRRMPGHVFGAYPEVDMHALPYSNDSFDIVVHSDTLEHVANPVHALSECRRVLKPKGGLCFTVPTVIGRLSRDRSGLPKSFHGNEQTGRDDFLVQTEFGADVWTFVLEAGFSNVEIRSVAYPISIAILARK